MKPEPKVSTAELGDMSRWLADEVQVTVVASAAGILARPNPAIESNDYATVLAQALLRLAARAAKRRGSHKATTMALFASYFDGER